MKIPEGFEYLEINSQIEQALESIFYKKKNTLIIGNAGTGKSEILSLCKAVDKKNKVASVFLAPTGVAAVRIGGQTLHSFFKLPLSMVEAEYVPLRKEVRDLINATDKFYIDEISMVRADILDSIDSLMKKATENFLKPFGGKQVIMTGDLYQIAPVVGSSMEEKKFYNARYGDNPYFFSSGMFSLFKEEFENIEFTKVYRQKQSEFTDILNRIRKGKQTDNDLSIINEKLTTYKYIQEKYPEVIYLSPFNTTVNKVNEKYLQMLSTDEYMFPAIIEGDINLKNHTVPNELWLKPGAKIMTLINSTDGLYQNGSIGTFERVIDRDHLLLEINGEDIVIERYCFEEYTYGVKQEEGEEGEHKKLVQTKKGSIKQFPLKLAYALTYHKSQGSTFEAGYIDFAKIFGDHMVYVALSRFRDLDKIGLKRKLEHEDIMINPYVINFMNSFSTNSNKEV